MDVFKPKGKHAANASDDAAAIVEEPSAESTEDEELQVEEGANSLSEAGRSDAVANSDEGPAPDDEEPEQANGDEALDCEEQQGDEPQDETTAAETESEFEDSGTDTAGGEAEGDDADDVEAESDDADDEGDEPEVRGSHAKGAHAKKPSVEEAPAANQEELQAQVQADREAAFDALGSADEVPADAQPTMAIGAVQPALLHDGESAFVAAAIDEMKARKRRGRLKVAGITIGALVGLVAIAYAVGCFVFSGHFLPGTTIGDYNVSMKSDQEVIELIDETVHDYTLEVTGNNFGYSVTGTQINLSADGEGIVKTMHEKEPFWQWPVLIFEPKHDGTDLLKVTYNRSAFEDDVKANVEFYNKAAVPPTNATIVYDQATKKFVVQPEVIGTMLDAESVLEDMDEAIEQLNEKVRLFDDNLLKPSVLSTDEKVIQAAELATGMVSAKLSLVMGGAVISEVDGSSLSPFVTMNENFEITFKEEEMNAWVNDLAYGFDTIGTERVFTRADGKEIVVPAGGEYGWEVDSEALKTAIVDGIRTGQVAQIEVPCVQTAAVYNGPNQRDWGNRYIDVDLSEQYVRFYGDDGSIIWESACISGSPDGEHNTGPGTWYVNNMESPSKLIGYEHGKKIYETMVTYWMAFEYSGIGFHDATWQPSFGGSMYANGYGSHGCINLPYDAAQSLYSIINIGDCVVVHF